MLKPGGLFQIGIDPITRRRQLPAQDEHRLVLAVLACLRA